jgi:hypothetical protein
LAFPFLRGGVIDLEDAEIRVRVAIGKGVEASAEDYELGDAAADGEGEFVFGVAGAGGHEGAHVAGCWREAVRETRDGSGGFAADDADRERVFEHFWSVEELVRGAAEGDALGGSAGTALDHVRASSVLGKTRVPPRDVFGRVGMLLIPRWLARRCFEAAQAFLNV